MATPLEVIGGIAALWDLMKGINKVVKTLNRARHSVKGAEEEIGSLCDNTDMFSDFLSTLCSYMDKTSSEVTMRLEATQLAELVFKVSRYGRRILARLMDVLGSVKLLKTSRPSGLMGKLRQLYLSLKWQQSRKDVELLKSDLESGKANISLVLQIGMIESLRRQIVKLQAASQVVPEHLTMKVELLEERIKNLRSRCRKAENKYKGLKQQHKPPTGHSDTDPSLELSEVVRKIVLTEIKNVKQALSTEPHVPSPSTPTPVTKLQRVSHSPSLNPKESSPKRVARTVRSRELNSSDLPDSTVQNVAAVTAPAKGHHFVATALFGPPEPRSRPRPARRSYTDVDQELTWIGAEDIAPQPIIVDRDDEKGVREEYRRPRKPRRRDVVVVEDDPAPSSVVRTSSSPRKGKAAAEIPPSERWKKCSRPSINGSVESGP